MQAFCGCDNDQSALRLALMIVMCSYTICSSCRAI